MATLQQRGGVDLALLCCLLLLPTALLSHGADIPLGSTLSPGSNSASPWTSPNNTFSLSFTPSPSSPSLFVAAITYAGGGVPIWTAGAGAAVDSRGSLRLTSGGDLQLLNGSGAVLWSSDTGNLVLKNNSTTLWQSFQHPTDTVVTSQRFTSGMKLTSGPYSFAVDESSGNLTLTWTSGGGGGATVTYLNKGYNNTSFPRKDETPTLEMQSNGIVLMTNGGGGAASPPAVVAYSSNYGESGDMLRFLRLDADGNLRAYSAARGSGGAAAEQWSAVAGGGPVPGVRLLRQHGRVRLQRHVAGVWLPVAQLRIERFVQPEERVQAQGGAAGLPRKHHHAAGEQHAVPHLPAGDHRRAVLRRDHGVPPRLPRRGVLRGFHGALRRVGALLAQGLRLRERIPVARAAEHVIRQSLLPRDAQPATVAVALNSERTLVECIGIHK
ncbi:unnamed protein product [Urochloa humidicola]